MMLSEVKKWRFWLDNIITCIAYAVTGVICNFWMDDTGSTPLWLGTGVALASILWFGYRAFLGIFMAELFLTIVIGKGSAWNQDVLASILISSGATLQAVLCAWFMQRYTYTKTPFYSVRDVNIFVFGVGFLCTLTSATIGTASLAALGFVPWGKFFSAWHIWWLGNAIGLITMTPVIMIWYQNKLTLNWKQWCEFCVLLIALGISIWLIYALRLPLTYVLLPFCVWATVRFGTNIAIIVAFIVAIAVVCLSIFGQFLMISPDISDSLLFLQTYVAVIFLTILILSAVLTEKISAEHALLQANLDLEKRISQRTQDLKEKNTSLQLALHDLKQAETQLIQAEKMSSLGVLTAGIAHEINNAVNFISANISPLKADVEDIILVLNKYGELTSETMVTTKLVEIDKLAQEINLPLVVNETHNLLKGMEEGANRTSDIVKNLRTFSRLDEGDLKLTNINHNIDSALMLLKNQYRDRIQIVKNYGDIPEMEVYPGKLNQVIMNILINAIHAITEKGDIYISTMKQTDKVMISIRDTGIGISKEHVTKIFEPFFTTKEVGKGTGLGLSISYGIIQEHHGTIEVKSDIGKGCEFIISLPLTR